MPNGNLLAQVPSYGLMGNVSISYPYSFLKLIISVITAGAGKSVIWCDKYPNSSYSRAYVAGLVLQLLRISAPCRNLGWRHLHSFTATSGKI